LPLLIVAATIPAFGNGVLRPTLTSRVTQAARRDEQGVVLGLTQSLSSVAMIVAPLVGTALIEHKRLVAWAMVAAGVMALGLVASVRDRRPQAAVAAS